MKLDDIVTDLLVQSAVHKVRKSTCFKDRALHEWAADLSGEGAGYLIAFQVVSVLNLDPSSKWGKATLKQAQASIFQVVKGDFTKMDATLKARILEEVKSYP